jgi:hypothetical protein
MFFNVRLRPHGLILLGGAHGLAEGIGDSVLKFASGDVVGARGLRPSQFERAVEDAATPGSREVTQVKGELYLTGGVALDEGSQTFVIKEEMTTTAVIGSCDGNLGVVGDPGGESQKLAGVREVVIDGKHRVIGI